ncbi:MAG: prepilin-type N-terminal cleavage/methylation domain-containing protein [Phycisphaerae bacterium]|nr:prepilin-type N-terminal cleavage/methylation domain-containing protein [Phycisphaerae bacterium]
MKRTSTTIRRSHSPARRRPPARGGFTFVEMMMALTIMGMVMVAVAGATYIGTQTYDANQTDAQLGNSARAIMERIAREIRAASSVSCSTNHLTIIPASGDPAQIDYVLEGGQFFCDRTGGAGTQRYTLLGAGDEVAATQFEITISTTVVEEVTVTAMVTVQLNLLANGRPLVVSASACPRQNVNP